MRPAIYFAVEVLFGGRTPTLTDTWAASITAGVVCAVPVRQYPDGSGNLLYLN